MASRPDLVVAIDFGMCCTGVAFAIASNLFFDDPRVFTEWPDRPQASDERKTPSIMAYDMSVGGPGSPVGWGFSTPITNVPDTMRIAQHFKTQLQIEEKAVAVPTTQGPQAEQTIRDWLGCLYTCIQEYFNPMLRTFFGKSWDNAHILFLLSFPALWTSETVHKFESIAVGAGFSTADGKHTIEMRLSEPLTAAIHAVRKDQEIGLKTGDSVLIVDAGGGTTDLSLVTVEMIQEDQVYISERKSSSDYVGAAWIDMSFRNMVRQRLEDSPSQILCGQAATLATKLMRSPAYQSGKKELLSMVETGEPMELPIPSLPTDISCEESKIQEGKMIVSGKDLAPHFDLQIEKIKSLITEFLEGMLDKSTTTIDHVILCGGLCSSTYAQKRLQDWNNKELREWIRHLPAMHVSSAPDMCVAQGLVIDAVQKLTRDHPAAIAITSRAGYGVLLRDDKISKLGASRAGKQQLEGKSLKKPGKRIEWVIRPGSPVRTDQWQTFTVHQYIYSKNGMDLPLDLVSDVRIVSNISRYMYLPPVWNPDAVKIFTTIRCNFRPCVVKENKSSWSDRVFHTRKQVRVEFQIWARVGGSEMEFECRTKDGESIHV